MKKSYILFLFLFLFSACKSHKPISEREVIRYIDSTVVNYVDSTIFVDVPVERIVNVVALPDTLKMETSLATAEAWVDTTTNTLKGSLENKDTALQKVVYLPSKERIVYRDSIQEKEIPVEVIVEKKRVPGWCWWTIAGLATIVGLSYRKLLGKLFKFVIALFTK